MQNASIPFPKGNSAPGWVIGILGCDSVWVGVRSYIFATPSLIISAFCIGVEIQTNLVYQLARAGKSHRTCRNFPPPFFMCLPAVCFVWWDFFFFLLLLLSFQGFVLVFVRASRMSWHGVTKMAKHCAKGEISVSLSILFFDCSDTGPIKDWCLILDSLQRLKWQPAMIGTCPSVAFWSVKRSDLPQCKLMYVH